MDIGRIQPTTVGIGNSGLDHTATQPTPGETPQTQRQLIQAVKALNPSDLFGQESELTFVFDRHTHKALVRVVDKRTREVLMQIPPEHVIRMAQERG